jgi:hypothetical protein
LGDFQGLFFLRKFLKWFPHLQKKMSDYMDPVLAILQQVQVEPVAEKTVPVFWYVGGAGVATMVALKLLSPSCVKSETEEGLSVFSVGKALLFSVAAMALVYFLVTKM